MDALVYRDATSPIKVERVPIPEAEPGSAVVKVLGATITPNLHKFFGGTWAKLPRQPAPFTLSAPAIARIHALGPDAAILKHGQLVFVDFNLVARDSPDIALLQGYLYQPGAAGDNLAKAWKHGTLAEYARLPLENLHPLDEDLLINKLGYTIPDLLQAADCFIAVAALIEGCGLQAGDKIIVAPSTGRFSGPACQAAIAMGAHVIAAGRTPASLDRMAKRYAGSGRLTTVVLSGDGEKDTAALRLAAGGNGADSFFDMSPTCAKVTHIAPCIKALRRGGRAALVGGDIGDVPLPYIFMMVNNINVRGSYMFERKHVEQTLKLIEIDLLKLGSKQKDFRVQAGFRLTDMEKAYAANDEDPGFGNFVVVEP